MNDPERPVLNDTSEPAYATADARAGDGSWERAVSAISPIDSRVQQDLSHAAAQSSDAKPVSPVTEAYRAGLETDIAPITDTGHLLANDAEPESNALSHGEDVASTDVERSGLGTLDDTTSQADVHEGEASYYESSTEGAAPIEASVASKVLDTYPKGEDGEPSSIKDNPKDWFDWLTRVLLRILVDELYDANDNKRDPKLLEGKTFRSLDGRARIEFGSSSYTEVTSTGNEILIVVTPSGENGKPGDDGEKLAPYSPSLSLSKPKDMLALMYSTDGKGGHEGTRGGDATISTGSNTKLLLVTGEGGAGGRGGRGSDMEYSTKQEKDAWDYAAKMARYYAKRQGDARNKRTYDFAEYLFTHPSAGSGGDGADGRSGGQAHVTMDTDCEMLAILGPGGGGGNGGNAGKLYVTINSYAAAQNESMTGSSFGLPPNARLAIGGSGGDGGAEELSKATLGGDSEGLLCRSVPGSGGKGGKGFRVETSDQTPDDLKAINLNGLIIGADQFRERNRARDNGIASHKTTQGDLPCMDPAKAGNTAGSFAQKQYDQAKAEIAKNIQGMVNPASLAPNSKNDQWNLMVSALDGQPGLPGRPRAPIVSNNVEVIDGEKATLQELGLEGNAWKALTNAIRHPQERVKLLGSAVNAF